MHKKNKKYLNNVEKFYLDPSFIYTVCHQCLYRHSIRLFEHKKYHIRTTQLHQPA